MFGEEGREGVLFNSMMGGFIKVALLDNITRLVCPIK